MKHKHTTEICASVFSVINTTDVRTRIITVLNYCMSEVALIIPQMNYSRFTIAFLHVLTSGLKLVL